MNGMFDRYLERKYARGGYRFFRENKKIALVWDCEEIFELKEAMFSTEQVIGERSNDVKYYQGRGSPVSLRLGRVGKRMVIRHYHHGGALRGMTRDIFFTWPPRPFQELRSSEESRRRGILTPKVLAAGVELLVFPFYRGNIITEEVEGGQDALSLFLALKDSDELKPRREKALQVIARAIAKLHKEGVYHRDLNLKNILIKINSSDTWEVYILDLDKTKPREGEVRKGMRLRNLRRLERSVDKFNRKYKIIDSKEKELFLIFYHQSAQDQDFSEN